MSNNNNETLAELMKLTAGVITSLPAVTEIEKISRIIEETAQLRRQSEDKLRKEIQAAQNENNTLKAELNAANLPGEDLYDLLGIHESQRDPENDDVFRLLRSKLLELDNEKIALAKQLTELQSVINQLKQDRLQLQKRQDDLRRAKEDALQSNVSEHYNSTSMKIALYKKLGVHIESASDGSESAEDKVLVIDKLSNLASVLSVDQKYLDYFISNYIWDRIGGVKE